MLLHGALAHDFIIGFDPSVAGFGGASGPRGDDSRRVRWFLQA